MLHKKYILFGAGSYGKKVLQWFGKANVAFFCDNRRNGESIHGIDIISYEKMKNIYADYYVVLTVERIDYVKEISEKLSVDGIPYYSFEDAANKYIDDVERPIYNFYNNHLNFRYESTSNVTDASEILRRKGGVNSYFWQDLWAAKHIFEGKPEYHYDIGSRVDGFISHLSSFGQKVRLLDIRPLKHEIPNVEFVQCDATSMDNIPDDSIESLSALCSLEHFGLGRYGDPIDPEACFKCFDAIQKKIKYGGIVYIAVPVGREHLEWHVHRVFNASTIVDAFSRMNLLEYSTTFEGNIEYNTELHKYDTYPSSGGNCFGLFMLQKNE